MDFFTKVTDTLSDVGKASSQKARELSGIAKLKMEIRSKEEYINKQYTAIGKQYYELHKDDEIPLFAEIMFVADAKEEIAAMERKLNRMQGKKVCSACQAKIHKTAQFCPECGERCN